MAGSQFFNPDKDIPSLADKVILITGGTAGLGAGSIACLAKHSPAHIFFTGRNQKKADALIARVQKDSPDVKLSFITCDISSFAAVRQLAETFTAQAQRLDILMLNAGIMAVDAAVSPDGFETQFATNHLGHALLVRLLMPTLLKTAELPGADVRVINMSSLAYQQAPKEGIQFATLRSAQESLGGAIMPGHKWARYGQAKLAQLLYSRELAVQHPQITSIAVHPGFIFTGLFDLPLFTKLPALVVSIGKQVSVEQGHYQQCWAATCDKAKLTNGGYYEPWGKLSTPTTKTGKDNALGEELWKWQEALFDEEEKTRKPEV